MDENLQRWQTELKKGYAKPCVLYVLSKGDYNAYRITKEVRRLTNGQIVIAGSNIYPMLRGLAKEGLVERFEKEDQKLYKITLNGREFLENLLEHFRDFLETMLSIVNKEEGV
ncbi:MAG: PadR family transcriptional regulator [Candidatus Hodarchaeota archaeon]